MFYLEFRVELIDGPVSGGLAVVKNCTKLGRPARAAFLVSGLARHAVITPNRLFSTHHGPPCHSRKS